MSRRRPRSAGFAARGSRRRRRRWRSRSAPAASPPSSLGTIDGAPAVTGAGHRAPADGLVAPSLTTPNLTDKAAVAAAVQRVLEARRRRAAAASRWSCPTAPPRSRWSSSRSCRPSAEDLAQLVRWQVSKRCRSRSSRRRCRGRRGVADADRRPTTSSPSRGRTSSPTTSRRSPPPACRSGSSTSRPSTWSTSCWPATRAGAATAGDWLLVHVTPDASTLAIVRDGALLLFRHRPLDGEGSLADLGHQTAMYYEDRLSGHGLVAGRGRAPATSAPAAARRPAGPRPRARAARAASPVVEIDPRALVRIADRIARRRRAAPPSPRRSAPCCASGWADDAAHQPRHPAVLQRAPRPLAARGRGAGRRARVHGLQRQRVPAPVGPAGRPRRRRRARRGAARTLDDPRRRGAAAHRSQGPRARHRRRPSRPTASSTRAPSRGRRSSTTSRRRCRRR